MGWGAFGFGGGPAGTMSGGAGLQGTSAYGWQPGAAGLTSPYSAAGMANTVNTLMGSQGGGGGSAPAAPNAGFNPQVAQQYAKQLTSQWNQAKQANQAQLQQMQGLAAGYGQGQLNASNQLTQQQVAQGQQNMAQRGLYNSTVAQGVQQGAQSLGNLRNSQINDATTQLQLGVLGQNQIQYPNLGAYASLMSQPGAFSGNSGISTLLGALTNLNYGNGSGATPAKK